jgi:hypothetical protein
LTELFSESSEPSFDVFPLEEFRKLFPEGVYTFRGKTIDGKNLLGTTRLTHDIPDGPRIFRPGNDAEVSRSNAVVAWKPVRTTGRRHRWLPGRGDPGGSPAGAQRRPPGQRPALPVPAEFLQHGTEYKAEVLAIEASGNQTLTEVAFTVK